MCPNTAFHVKGFLPQDVLIGSALGVYISPFALFGVGELSLDFSDLLLEDPSPVIPLSATLAGTEGVVEAAVRCVLELIIEKIDFFN